MASISSHQSLQGTITIDINAIGRTYKNVTFGALRFLCSEVIQGQEFMKLYVLKLTLKLVALYALQTFLPGT